MLKLKKILSQRLKGAKDIAVLGVGSDLRADDAAGELVARSLAAGCKNRKVKFFFGSTAPENLTGEIKKFAPTDLLIIDSADLGLKSGQAKILSAEEIGGVSFSTHRLPTKVMVDYLVNSLKCKATIIAIQPKILSFGKSPSKEIKETVMNLSKIIKEIIHTTFKEERR